MDLQISKYNNPTKLQNQAIDQLRDFINTDDRFCVLFGSAGTGKTFVLSYYLTHYYKHNCVVTAPTHKAVRVVESVLGRPGKTLQSLLGLRLNTDLENFDIAHPPFDPMGEDYIKNYKLVIIDECSMINKGLFYLICLKAQQHNTKVLFVGDACQLPPIGEEISLTFSIKNKIELTEIIRQKDSNPLLTILDIIRSDIKNGSNDFHPYLIKHRKAISNHEGYILVNEVDFKKVLLQYYLHPNFSKNVDFIRTLAWTNECVGKWNNIIRNAVFNDPDEILHNRDLLTSYTTIVDEFNSPIIVNSEDYIISTMRNYTDSYKISNYAINLINVINHDESGLIGGLETSTIKIVNPHSREGFTNFYNHLSMLHYRAMNSAANNRKMSWRNYYEFKNDHLLMFSFKLGANNNRAQVKKDLDYGYALTVHKSQGSTYDNIAIDLEDIMFNKSVYAPDKLLRDKLIYVALSRAKNIAIIKL